jgi:hypothetical protein
MQLPASVTRVMGPNGTTLPLVHAGDRVLVNLTAPGLYSIEAAGSRRVVGVNVGQPEVANVMHTTLQAQAPRLAARLATRPWWTYAAIGALFLVLLEWATWQRRITV